MTSVSVLISVGNAIVSSSSEPTFAEIFQTVMLFIMLGVAAALVIAGVAIGLAKKSALVPYVKAAVTAAFVYAISALSVIRTVHFAEECASEEPAAFDVFQIVMTWVTVAVVIALIVVGVVIYAVKRGGFMRYVKIAGLSFFIYAVLLAIAMLVYTMVDNSDNYEENGMLTSNVLVPVIVICGVIVIATVVLTVLRIFRSNAFKVAAIISGLALLASVIVAAVLIGSFYKENISNDGYYNSDIASVNNVALYIGMGVLIVALVLIGIFCDTSGRRGIDTKTIATAAICIALSFALSYIKLFDMPFGGAITLASLLPILVFSYIYGVRRGLMVGLIYGMLQAIQDPYIIHPAQFLLDYPIAFSFICCGGAFANIKALKNYPQVKFVLGAAVAGVGRYISHVISGIFAFSAYAADAGMAAVPYSFAYNAFVFGDIVIAIIAGAVLFSSKTFIKTIANTFYAPVNKAKPNDTPAATEQNAEKTDDTNTNKNLNDSADGSVTAQSDGLANTDPSAKYDERT